MGRLRLFTAVEMSGEVKEALGPILRECALKFPMVKWTDPDQLHMTLRFLGDQDEAKVPLIRDVLRGVGRLWIPFGIELGGLGSFPGPLRPAVFFVPVFQGADVLGALADAVGQGLRNAGIIFDEKEFRAHVTLGRVKTLKGSGTVPDTLGAALSTGGWKMNVGQFVLFQSRLTEKGPIYTPLEKIPLGP